jgi:hypothetical protein
MIKTDTYKFNLTSFCKWRSLSTETSGLKITGKIGFLVPTGDGEEGEKERKELSCLPMPIDLVFIGSQFTDPHWPSGMQLIGTDAYFRTKPELPAIRKLGRGIEIDTGGIDTVKEYLRCGIVLRDDRFGVL